MRNEDELQLDYFSVGPGDCVAIAMSDQGLKGMRRGDKMKLQLFMMVYEERRRSRGSMQCAIWVRSLPSSAAHCFQQGFQQVNGNTSLEGKVLI